MNSFLHSFIRFFDGFATALTGFFAEKILYFCIFTIKAYQVSFSYFVGRSCRFYPSCSNFALWIFEFNLINFNGFYFGKIFSRILSCQPLYRGGISYPCLRLKRFATCLNECKNYKSACLKSNTYPIKPIFWLIPIKDKLDTISVFYIIKSL